MIRKSVLTAAVFLLMTAAVFSQNNFFKSGDLAPEIILPDMKGDSISLSSFRNKIVLIDFWGTWCAPCVKEQAHLKVLYDKYKNSAFKDAAGFEIYGVSLDNKKKQLEAVIKKYKINWTQVSDFKFWLSPVVTLYSIEELPFNVLIDGKGIIIGINLHDEDLENAIKNQLK